VARPPNLAVLLIHSGQLLLRIISKSDATRCQILRLKCTKFDFRWGSEQDPAQEAYSALPDPLAVFKGAYFKREGGEEGEGRGMGGEGRGKGKRRGNGDEERGGARPPNILA